MSVNDLRATFTKGEVTPLVWGREDLTLYKTALAAARNFNVVKQGGMRRRSGTRYYGATKGTGPTELILFSFNDSQSYALEFGDGYIRFWTDQGQILSGGVPYEIASPYTGAQVSRIQCAQSNDVLYLAHPDVKPKQLNRFADDNWTITDVAFVDGPYLPINDTGNTVNWTTTPIQGASVTFTHASTAGINNGAGFTAADVGRHYRVQTLGVWVWGVITSVTNNKTIVVSVKNSVLLPPNPSTAWNLLSGTELVGNTVQEGGNQPHGLTSADIGKVFLANALTGSSIYVRLTRIIANQSLEFQLIGPNLPSVTNSATFQLGAFSAVSGYPGSVQFFSGRLCWGRTQANPRGIALSVTGAPTVYSPTLMDGTVTDDLGMFLDVTAGKSDEFHWLADGARLLLGSPSSLRSLGPSDPNAALSPSNVSAKLEIPQGSTPVVPVQIGPNTFPTKRFGQGIIDLAYQYEAGGVVGPEQSLLSEHLFHDGIRRMTFTESPEGILWSLTNSGTLVAMTYDRYEEVVGFSQHPLRNGTVKSILAVPSTVLNRDALFLIVQRTINGVLRQYVEVLERPFYADELKNAFYVDCGATYNGAPTNVVTGLGFLEGETVDLLVDGAVVPQVVVTGGKVTIPNEISGSVIQIGIPIDAYFTLLPLAVSTQEGNQRGLQKRIPSVVLDLLETRGGKVGVEGYEMFDIMHRSPSDPMGQAPALFTGTKRITVQDAHDSSSQLMVVCDQPLPMTVRAININIDARP